MAQLTAPALLVLQRQLGHITSAQLCSAGVSPEQRRHLLAHSVLEPLGRSVYTIPGAQVTLLSRLVGLCLQHPRGFVTGATAGSILDLRRMPRVSLAQFCMPHGARFDTPNWVQLRQSTHIPDSHVRTLENGIRIASFERLAFDLARSLNVPDLSSVVEQMLQRGQTTPELLGAIASEMCRPRRGGSATFARMLLRRHIGVAAESHPELRVLEGLLRRGIPVVPQTHLDLPNGRRIRIDMAVPAIRWAVEVDVHPDHLLLEGSTRDRQRDRQAHLIGWQVERVTTIDLFDLPTVLGELEELYRRRCTATPR